MFDRPVFSIGERQYQLADVLLAAMWWRQWPGFERLVVEGLACSQAAAAGNGADVDDEVADLATEFRYDRDLIAAVEMEAWLDQAGLTVSDWMDALTRRVRRNAGGPHLQGAIDRSTHGDQTFDAALVADGMCTGAFRSWAVALAGRAAVAGSTETGVDEDTERLAAIDAVCAEHAALLDRWTLPEANIRMAWIAGMDAIHAAVLRESLTPEAMRARVTANHLDWLQIELDTLTVTDEHIAREAILCCQDEGLSLAQMGAEMRVPVERRTLLLEDAGSALQPVLLSAAPGEIVGPFTGDQGVQLLTILQKTPPTLDDELVRTRAHAVIVSGITHREITNRVRWSLRF